MEPVNISRPNLGNNRQFRLVELLPGQTYEEIACLFRNVSLDEKPQYEALSYVWGDPAITHRITVDRQPYQITTNLASALRHIRKPTEARSLWIDAICINQRDHTEKTGQIGIMGDIYRNAQRGLMWLGDIDSLNLSLEDTASAYAVIEMLASNKHISELPCFMQNCHSLFAKAFRAIALILASPWWSRIWTV
jgi:Heterokaryon incompatibility protein (HET)